jgi:hypothetical protein
MQNSAVIANHNILQSDSWEQHWTYITKRFIENVDAFFGDIIFGVDKTIGALGSFLTGSSDRGTGLSSYANNSIAIGGSPEPLSFNSNVKGISVSSPMPSLGLEMVDFGDMSPTGINGLSALTVPDVRNRIMPSQSYGLAA